MSEGWGRLLRLSENLANLGSASWRRKEEKGSDDGVDNNFGERAALPTKPKGCKIGGNKSHCTCLRVWQHLLKKTPSPPPRAENTDFWSLWPPRKGPWNSWGWCCLLVVPLLTQQCQNLLASTSGPHQLELWTLSFLLP